MTAVDLVADASPSSGLGHVSRSSAVAAALRVRGLDARCHAWHADDAFERDGVVWQPLRELADVAPRDVLVVDSYDAPATWIESAAATAAVVLLNSRMPGEHAAALVVDVTAGDSEGRVLGGLRYAALRPALWGLPQRRVRAETRTVLVASGAGDPGGVGAAAAAAVAERLPNALVMAVRGPHAPDVPLPKGVRLLRALASLHEPLLNADLVVTTAGQTLLEAVATGAPTVAVVAVDNQREQADRIANDGAALLASGPEEAAEIAAVVASDPARRGALARRAQELVDGYGALRVGYAIAALTPPDRPS